MAKQRYINTKFWSDNFVSELNPLDKYLFLYFLTNEHTNICGIYEVPLITVSFETGLEIDMLKKMLKRLAGKVYYIDGWVYIKNFAKHQAVNDSIVKGIETAKKEVPAEIVNKINELGQPGYSLGTDSPQDPTYLNTNTNIHSPSSKEILDSKKDVDEQKNKDFVNVRNYWFKKVNETGTKARFTASDGKRLKDVLREFQAKEVAQMIDFYLDSEKFEKNGALLRIALSDHSISVWQQNGHKQNWK